MNRYKFRGKTQVTNGFVYGYYIRQYGCKNGKKYFTDFIYSEDELYYPIDINTLGQYTGLKDKNGVEIYKGDIVKINGFHYEIFYAQEECCFKMKRKYDDLFLTKIKEKHIEVFGNIYEDKELLENE